MNDQIKQYIDQQISSRMLSFNNAQQYQAGNPLISPHTHDGNNSPKINEVNVIPKFKIVGFVQVTAGTASENTVTITTVGNLGGGVQNPTAVYFYGIAYKVSSYTFILTTTGYPLASNGDVYSQNGVNYTVTAVRVSGSPYMSFSGTTPPTPSGTLIRVSGSGDTGITYTNVATSIAGVTYKAVINGSAHFGNKTTQGVTFSSGTSNVNPQENIVQSNSSTFFDGSVTLVDKNSTSFTYWQPTVDADNINLAAVYDNSDNLIGNIQVISFTNTSVTLQAPLSTGWLIQGSIIIT